MFYASSHDRQTIHWPYVTTKQLLYIDGIEPPHQNTMEDMTSEIKELYTRAQYAHTICHLTGEV